MDRLTILARKIVERPDREDFEEEYKYLWRDVMHDPNAEVQWEYPNGLWVKGMLLAATNAAIWQREDRLRELRGRIGQASYGDIGAVAVEIQELNDRRAALIAELNDTPGEKLYK